VKASGIGFSLLENRFSDLSKLCFLFYPPLTLLPVSQWNWDPLMRIHFQVNDMINFFWENIFLAYITYTGDFIVTFPYMLTVFLSSVHCHLRSLSSPSLLLKMISVGFRVLFTQVYKVQRTYSSSFTLSICPPYLTSAFPQQDLFYLPALCNLSVYSLFKGVFAMVFLLRIYCTLIMINFSWRFSVKNKTNNLTKSSDIFLNWRFYSICQKVT
jgi:hypothetical protein